MPGSRTIRRRNPPKGTSDRDILKGFWDSNYSGDMSGDLADMFMSIYGDNGYHSGGIGGVDRQMSGVTMNEYGEASGPGFNQSSPFGNDWLGPDSRMNDAWGDPVNFRRDVSPYMMYNNPEDPNMWDELPNPATPSRGEAGMSNEFMADPFLERYTQEYQNDRSQDLWNIARGEQRRTGVRTLGDILSEQQNRIDALRRRMAGGR